MLLVTGVSGALGALVAERLAGREDVVLGTRAGLPGTRRLDFDAPETLPEALTEVETLLLISAGYGRTTRSSPVTRPRYRRRRRRA